MIGALWILAFTVVVGIVLYIMDIRWRRRHAVTDDVKSEATDVPAQEMPAEDGAQCCGLHLVCEKDSLSPMSAEILYYDDEELDRFAGRDAGSYSASEEEEFREVLMTLLPGDRAGWARSITQRRIELPPDVKDELLMLINEQRNTLKIG